MASNQNPSLTTVAKNFGCAASAAAIAELITLPLDTMKVRMQLASTAGAVPGFQQTAVNILKQVCQVTEQYLTKYNFPFEFYRFIQLDIDYQDLFRL